MKEDIVAKLDGYAETKNWLDIIALDKEVAVEAVASEKAKLIDSVLTPEIRQQVADIEAEFAPKLDAIDVAFEERSESAKANLAKLKAEIESGVKSIKETVHGKYFMAVYTKGKSGNWDSAKLDGYAVAHPEVECMKLPDGKPSVSIRAKKE